MEVVEDDSSSLIALDKQYPLSQIVSAVARACSELKIPFHLKSKTTFWLSYEAGDYIIKIPRKRRACLILIDVNTHASAKNSKLLGMLAKPKLPELSKLVKNIKLKLENPVDFYARF